MNQQDIIQGIHSGLSVVREWIEKVLEDNKEGAIPVISLNFSRLQKVFSSDLLERRRGEGSSCNRASAFSSTATCIEQLEL